MNVPRLFNCRFLSWRTLRKASHICLLFSLLAGLIPPPVVRSVLPSAAAELADALLPALPTAQAAAEPVMAITADRPLEAAVAAPAANGVASAVPGGTTSTQITGTAFRDFNSDGLKSTGTITDTGVSGVTVTAYDATGAQAGVATTDSNGDYTITGLAAGMTYRIEFSNLPTGYYPTTHGNGVGDTNGTTVQFAAAGTSQVSLGVNYPDDYSQANPQFVIPLYKPGNSGTAALEKFSYDAPKTGDDSGIPESLLAGTGVEDPVSLATPAEIGTVWGIAYQRTQARLFTASILRRHAAMADGPGYVYIIDPTTGVAGKFNLAGVTPSNAGTPIDVGSVTRTNTGLTTDDNDVAGQLNRDLDAFAKVGTMSFGDADIDETGNTLWLVNLNEKTLLTVDVSGATATLNNAAPATLAPLVNEYAIPSLPNAPACTGGELRPWGLKFYRGQGYLGVVCDASTSADVTDLDAYVLAFDPQNPSVGFTTAVTFGLNYSRELSAVFSGSAHFGAWQPWTNDWATISATIAAYPDGTTSNQSHHMPLVSDIDFTDDGSMVIALLDRNGYMLGRENLAPYAGSPSSPKSSLVTHISAGDIIQACNIGGTFVVEGTGGCTVHDDGAGTTEQANYTPPQPTNVTDDGPSNSGEFYYNDTYSLGAGHNEVGLGALAVLPGRDEVVSTVMDPLGYNTIPVTVTVYGLDVNGVHYYNSTAGNIQDGYLLTKRDVAAGNRLFAKANGMGDLELLLDPAPIEIGNRVWLDDNHNGIQDPGEDFISSVTVLLTDGNGNSYTAVTNAQGEYYFNSSNVSGGLQSNTTYTLTIDTTQSALTGYELAPANVVTTSTTIADGVDSDAILDGTLATILLTTGNAGENDHSFDFGFHPSALSLGNRLFYDTNNDGLDNDGSGGGLGSGISGVTVQLLDHNNVVTATVTTDADGYYRFDDLTGGATYTVLIPASNFAPGGKLAGYQNSTPTANDTTDANDNGSVTGTLGSGGDVRSAAITLVEGTLPMGETAIGGGTNAPDGDRHDDLTIDFGFYHLMLGNRVWYDDNRDGLDGGESGAAGIPVTLTTGSGVFVATTTTDDSGYYTFTNLISDTYIVQIQAPTNYLSSATDDATTNTDLNDNGQGNSGGLISSQVVALTPGSNGGAIMVESTHGHTHNLTIDFGIYLPKADLQVLKSVEPPTYTIGVATPVTFTIVITNYGPAAVVNAPVTDTQPVSITFDSWICTVNGVGSCGAASGSGDINSTVTLNAGSAATWIITATIDNTAEDPIINTAREALPANLAQDTVNRTDSTSVSVLPEQPLFSVGNRVWFDTNDDGTTSGPGVAEPVPQVLLQLVYSGTTTVLQTIQTGLNGYYRFDNVPAGDYQIVVAASNFQVGGVLEGYHNSSFYTDTTTLAGDNHDHAPNVTPSIAVSGVRSVPFTLGLGLQPTGETAVGGGDDGPHGDANSNLTIDFGFNKQHVGNQLWYETDNDGVYEPLAGEVHLPAGVVVVLHAVVGGVDTPFLTTTTDLNGQYNFAADNNLDLDPVNNPFQIYIAIPAGQAALNSYLPSTGARHVGGGVDNENVGAIDATGVVTSGLFYPLPGSTANGAVVNDALGESYQPTLDFGFVQETFTLGNRVWYDTDNDGFFDPTEAPVANVIVELLGSSGNYITETTTNASGYYSFTGLMAGSYLVEVTGRNFLPGAPLYGYQNSTPTTTTTTLADDSHDHGLNVVDGHPGVDGVISDLVTLGHNLQPTGESDGAHGPEGDANDNLTVDFGFYKLALGNQTWDDEDNNGHYEPAINTTLVVKIRLYAADGVTEIPVGPDGVLGTADDVTGGVTTGTNGRYEFSGLTPGDYIVKVKTPNGHVSSTGSGSPLIAGVYEPAADPDDNLDEDDNGSDGSGADAGWLVSLPVTLTPGDGGAEGNNVVDNAMGSTTNPTVDFGYVHLVSVGNIIWDDRNNNGLYDSATESGIDGVLVNLYYDANGDGDVTDAGETTPLTTTTTTGGGLYLFANLLAGNYLVELDAANFTTGSVLENYTSSTGQNGSVTGPYETAPDPDASGVDNDDNGTMQGKLGSGGVIRSAVVTLDEGSEPTNESPDNDAVTPDPNENLTVDFGLFRYAELGNYTWIDENKDGIQDSTEKPIAGVTVQLYNASDQLVASTFTGPTGHYTFTNLLPGDYYVKFTPPAGYAVTQQDQGGDTLDSDADPVTGQTITTTLVLDERDYTWDAGFLPTRFGDRVWIESDNDGLANTPGTTNIPVEGMVITATASSGDVYTTTTNAAGYYSFTVVADTYTVTYGSVPPAYGVVVPSATPGGSSASGNAGSYAESGNPDQSHAQDTLVTVATGETNWHVDFAFSTPLVSLGNRVWYDTNNNGIVDGGEQNVADGVLVELYQDTNGDNVFSSGDTFVTDTLTSGGYYTFTDLPPSTSDSTRYLVVISDTNFLAGGLLYGYVNSNGQYADNLDAAGNDNDHGAPLPAFGGGAGGGVVVASTPISLTVGTQPTGEGNEGNDPIQAADDANSNQTIDFGFYQLILGNRIWEDLNNNGQDDNEPDLNVTLIVTATNLTTGDVYTTPTDLNGYYTFTGIVSGTYVVSFDAPAGYVSSSTDGAPNAADLDDNGLGNSGGLISSAPFTVTPGVTISGVQTATQSSGTTINPSVDFGLWQPLSLGNRVWLDEGAGLFHNNGQDDNETGIQDVVLQLLNGDGTAYDRDPLTAGTQIYTATTNDTGYYSFTNLISGAYRVQVVASNFTAGNPLAAHVSSDDPATGANPDNNTDLDDNGPGTSSGVVTSGVIILTYSAEPITDGDSDANTNWTVDFGFWRPVLIGDRLWIENDNNGDASDGFVKAVNAGHVVTATSTTSGLAYTGITNGSGYYTITVPANDTYVVTTDLPDDVLDTPVRATDGSNPVGNNDLNHDRTGTTVVITTTDNLSIDFGFVTPVNLGNYVWVDSDGDGQQDEPLSAGLDGVTVTLTTPTGVVITTTTRDGGYYTFTNLLPNTTYTVTFTPPCPPTGCYHFTTPNSSGSTDASDSDAPTSGVVVVTTGTTDDYTIDAGLVQALNLGNYVWFDTDKQGDQDANERGIADAVVALYKADGVTPATDLNGDPVPTQTTDNTGLYNFTNLLPGGYVVKITMPSGYAPTVNQVGNPNTDNDTDSNIASNVGQVYSSGVVTLTVAGEPGSAIDGDGANGNLTVDFGFIGVNLGNYVWVDQNGNGEQDEPTSAGLNGVTVTLTLPGGVVTTTTTVNGGYYTFTNLLPNTIYTVTFSTPAGYLPTQANSGNDGTDSDPVNGRVQILLGTQDDLTIDAGFVRLASIGDRVWYDHNRNGLQDSGENGVANVTVELLNSSSSVISTTTTGAGGYYSFTNLAPGDYRIHFVLTTLPADTVVTRPNGGAADADSDADPITGMTAFTTLSPAESDPTWDLGIYLPPAAIGDRVWLDTNRNGVQEDGEPGLANVTVNLLDSSGTVISTTTTNASGYYSFTNRVPADYAVQVVRPDGYLPSPTGQGNDDVDSDIDPTTGRMPTTTLTPNEYDATWDAGFYPVVSLGNLVWHDANNNGQVDQGEGGLFGINVQLFHAGDDPLIASPVATDTTDVNGHYLFADLAPGRYFVYIPAPPVSYPWSSTVTDSRDNGEDNDDNGAQSAHGSNPWGPVMSPVIELTTNGEPINDGDDAQGDLTVDFGFFAPASLGDLVWLDSDKDGVQDQDETGVSGTADERGVPGVLVTLYSSVTNSVVATTTTDTHGRYLFDNLLPGDYFVEFALPTGYSLSPVDQGGNDAFDSDVNPTTLRTPVTVLTSGEHDPTLDMGLYLPIEPASIGDRVWYDTDKDGVQDSGETGVPGVSVTLYRADGAVVATTTTDVNGEYEFNSLPPGDYSVAFTPSIGYLISPQDVGGDETTDSDVDTNTGYTPVTTLTAGENDPTWDLGLYLPTEPASIGDTVWFDTDADGVQDSGETGVPGVLVTLYRADGTPLATTHTDPDGHYQFANLAPGDYFVEFDPLTGYVGTLADQGADDAVDSDANPNTGRTPVTTLSAGENDPTWDYGVYAVDVLGVNLLAPATIGDRIWIDSNKNGLQDGGEANAPGVTVKLYTAAGELLAVDITDANGNYSFPNLLPGDYYVEVLLPTGYSYSPVSTTPGNDTDSNADPATGRTPVVTLPSGVTDPSWDTGIFITPTGEVEDTEPTLSYRVFLPQVAR